MFPNLRIFQKCLNYKFIHGHHGSFEINLIVENLVPLYVNLIIAP